MQNADFQSLIKSDKYQVFLFVCPGMIPLNFARHPWFVVNRMGAVSRWEVLHRKKACATSWGHLHKDFLPPSQGVEMLPFVRAYWKGELVGMIEGDENSVARQVADRIENSKTTYPYCDRYGFTGPNSNTYAQWVLHQFPKCNLRLPWNCFGKDYL